ncbi:MAG: hypothetical protein A2504_04800 [Bdellovibrionales bacterium RIFOXYD12_FULL_39_22]|nr:MAG: hypothetical protein A2385_07025 [Bdellovibrionales bacterium RIFOXYB1_FULL_39_21]OFZ42015.1 MAG: hypothetical protein A2485_08995 [Bdellovibrionales bacterium RIFOXYC12_FULL_39_17]OFZ50731.1 MAG: hypothetical protein A2404_05945 [Bdellovibrionales bacterium RIFOXYC1_FULL_39_130]OFZ69499.1 MAG: hypothetical protein A2451_02460 [Bdellovibrionales bacterium RIFOXYC2_FULL_39_8]OFZ77954.1 MAG: hypothetical protein A2560_01115 [Bdellovibrionales bacterium RIFOXYD1_FULL_39_84]OFZ93610.1 MAG:
MATLDILHGLTQDDFNAETLGENKFANPLNLPDAYMMSIGKRVLFQNIIVDEKKIEGKELFSFERPGPFRKIFFDPTKINVGIVTCGGLCPGLNNVIRSITYDCLDGYKVKNVYGFKNGFEGLTSEYSQEALRLSADMVNSIHEQGGTILGTSRGAQTEVDMVDTLVKFNISILFVIGGDGTHHGSQKIAEEIKRRNLKISIIGIPKTIDNDILFIHKTFGFDTAVEEARKAISAAHVEAKGARNGIGLVKLMGRHSGFIALHATLASGSVNVCLIPEEEDFSLENLFERIEKRFTKSDHLVVVVAEGVGQDFLNKSIEKKYDASGNIVLQDIGIFLKKEISKHLESKKFPHTIKYIDPSYMIRSTSANAIDSSFCLRLGTYAVHAGMAGRTNVLIGYWNQHYCLVPIPLALRQRKQVNINGAEWRSVLEITVPKQK